MSQLAKHFGTLTEGQILEGCMLNVNFKIEATGFFTGEDCKVIAVAARVEESFWKTLYVELCSEEKFCLKLIDAWQMLLNMAANIGKNVESGVLIGKAMAEMVDLKKFKQELGSEGFQWKTCISTVDNVIRMVQGALSADGEEQAMAKILSEVLVAFSTPTTSPPDKC